jgi:hypothetical protein
MPFPQPLPKWEGRKKELGIFEPHYGSKIPKPLVYKPDILGSWSKKEIGT